MVDFNRRVNLEACHLYFFSRFFGVDKLDKLHKFGRLSPAIDGTFQTSSTRCEHFRFFFFLTLAITVRVIRVMISGIEFDRLADSRAGVFRGASVGGYRSSRSSQSSEIVSIRSLQNLHGCPDRPNRTQLYSIHATEVVSVVRVVCDYLGSASITIVLIISTLFKKPGTIKTIRTII